MLGTALLHICLTPYFKSSHQPRVCCSQKLLNTLKNTQDAIIPEPVLGQSCARHCSPAFLSDPLFQIIPSAQGLREPKIVKRLVKHTRSHHTRASVRSGMFQALLSCISLIPPISDHPISPGTSGIKNSLIA